MPKKSATARSSAQRNKPRVQKSIELVRQPKATPAESSTEPTAAATPVSTVETPKAKTTPASKATTASKAATRPKTESTESINGSATDSKVESTESVASAPKGSASERLAARRQAGQKQRSSVTLISAANYAYVRKDLIFIAILAAIMFSVIIILHFVPAIGG
jgi:cobalamin biosynthesis Mg chelatase CobN